MAKKEPRRPPKRPDPLGDARLLFAAKRVRDTRHSGDESRPGRDIRIEHLGQALATGFWERDRDRFHEGLKSWSYSIRGTTEDGRDLRIAVFFEPADEGDPVREDWLWLVTTYDVE